jgi:restriction endonuclease Mrr
MIRIRMLCFLLAPLAAIGCRAPAETPKQEPCMPQANPPEVEMNDKAWEDIMQKVKELEEEIAEMKKGLPPD